MEPKYPDVEVRLTDVDGNAFSVIGAVTGAMRRAGIPQEERDAFVEEASSGNYDHLLQTAMKTVTVN